ncbi:MAG: hypothetical protein ABEN55_04085 [Bradymonadaceae bacterium]
MTSQNLFEQKARRVVEELNKHHLNMLKRHDDGEPIAYTHGPRLEALDELGVIRAIKPHPDDSEGYTAKLTIVGARAFEMLQEVHEETGE